MSYSEIDLKKYERAEWYQERIEIQISDFEKDLKKDEKMAVTVVLANGFSIAATWFGYHNPNMIIVEGIDGNGRHTKALIPQSSVQIILTAVTEDVPS